MYIDFWRVSKNKTDSNKMPKLQFLLVKSVWSKLKSKLGGFYMKKYMKK